MIEATTLTTQDVLAQARSILTQNVASTTPQPAAGCCSTEKQDVCCEPSEKSACCGTTATSSGGCGCQ